MREIFIALSSKRPFGDTDGGAEYAVPDRASLLTKIVLCVEVCT